MDSALHNSSIELNFPELCTPFDLNDTNRLSVLRDNENDLAPLGTVAPLRVVASSGFNSLKPLNELLAPLK